MREMKKYPCKNGQTKQQRGQAITLSWAIEAQKAIKVAGKESRRRMLPDIWVKSDGKATISSFNDQNLSDSDNVTLTEYSWEKECIF